MRDEDKAIYQEGYNTMPKVSKWPGATTKPNKTGEVKLDQDSKEHRSSNPNIHYKDDNVVKSKNSFDPPETLSKSALENAYVKQILFSFLYGNSEELRKNDFHHQGGDLHPLVKFRGLLKIREIYKHGIKDLKDLLRNNHSKLFKICLQCFRELDIEYLIKNDGKECYPEDFLTTNGEIVDYITAKQDYEISQGYSLHGSSEVEIP